MMYGFLARCLQSIIWTMKKMSKSFIWCPTARAARAFVIVCAMMLPFVTYTGSHWFIMFVVLAVLVHE
jgi:hypothetical protein